jgi:hypothetical protein
MYGSFASMILKNLVDREEGRVKEKIEESIEILQMYQREKKGSQAVPACPSAKGRLKRRRRVEKREVF